MRPTTIISCRHCMFGALSGIAACSLALFFLWLPEISLLHHMYRLRPCYWKVKKRFSSGWSVTQGHASWPALRQTPQW